MFKVDSPLRVAKTKSSDWILNLNNYRNTHYQTLNKTKINYKEYIREQVESLPVFKQVKVTYTLYPKTQRKCDVSNVCSIHSKYFLDALVEYGRLPDDTYEFVPEETYRFGSVDKNNPRVEIEICEYEN